MTDKVRAVMNVYKRKSETPLQTIERYVAAYPNYKDVKMTYAGRLDPMAEGVLIVLAGEKNKEREKYTGLDKDYEFEFMLGVETDTFDVLGKIVGEEDAKKGGSVSIDQIRKAAEKYVGKIQQAYPAYSSKVIDGTPLFQLAREGKTAGMALPTHEVTVSQLEIIGEKTITRENLEKEIVSGVSAVAGDFRQEEILALWHAYFAEKTSAQMTIYKARLSCGSGFYVRQLVSDIGRDLGVGAVTTAIKRTRVGRFTISDSYDIPVKS